MQLLFNHMESDVRVAARVFCQTDDEDVEVLWCEGHSVQLQLQTEHLSVRHNQEV